MTPEERNELRVRVALALGWRCLGGHDWIAASEPMKAEFSQVIPDFTTSLDAAMQCVEALRKEGWRASIWIDDGGAQCDFSTKDGRWIYGEKADKLALAICLAFVAVRARKET